MLRVIAAVALCALLPWVAAPASAEGSGEVTGRVVDRGGGTAKVPVAIRVRGADGDTRDLLVRADGSFAVIGLRDQSYSFQAERPAGRGQIAISLPVTLYIYEGARYQIEFPFPRNGAPSVPRVTDRQPHGLQVIR